MATETITRGALAKQTGCNIETIRYYEDIGLLQQPSRTASGYRVYNADHARRLRFILRAKELGFDRKKIAGLLVLSDSGDVHTRAEVKSLTQTHIDEISERIRDLQKLKKRLNEISSHCDGSGKSAEGCPIITTLFGETPEQG